VIDLATGPLVWFVNSRPARKPRWPGSGAWCAGRRGPRPSFLSTTIRNPTFIPDVADLFVFRLKATNALGETSLHTLELKRKRPGHPAGCRRPLLRGRDCSASISTANPAGYDLETSTNLHDWTVANHDHAH